MRSPWTTFVSSAAIGAGFLLVSADARALGPLDLEVGAKVGYGTNPQNYGPNPLAVGLGARGGVAISGFYGGVGLMYYFGGSKDVTTSITPGGPSVSISEHTLLYGVEAGYGAKILEIFKLRAQLGIGEYQVSASGGGGSSSYNNLYLEPGATVMMSLGTVFIGADANLLVLTSAKDASGNSTTDTAFTVHGQVGVTF
jgi:hypothetical protein